MNAKEESLHDVAAEANRVRGRLLRIVEKLNQRRHDATDLPLQLHKHAYEIAVAGGIGIFTIGIELFLAHRRAARNARPRRRWQLLTQLWSDPDRALRSQRRPFVLDALRSVGISLITAAAMIPARRAVARLVGPPEAHRPAENAS
jgi:hypothetical protein